MGARTVERQREIRLTHLSLEGPADMFTQLKDLDHINLSGMEIRSALYLLGWQSLHEFLNSGLANDEILESLHKIIFIAQRRHLANGYIQHDWIINLRNIVRYLAEDALPNLLQGKICRSCDQRPMQKFRREIMSPVKQHESRAWILLQYRRSHRTERLYIFAIAAIADVERRDLHLRIDSEWRPHSLRQRQAFGILLPSPAVSI